MYNNFFNQPAKSPQQLQQEIQQEMNRYNQLYGIQQQQIPVQQNGGRYFYVNSYDEVVNAPISFDGEATLFICFNKGTIWSKKFSQGQTFIQTFKFSADNNFVSQQETQAPQENDFEARLTALENLIKGEIKNE